MASNKPLFYSFYQSLPSLQSYKVKIKSQLVAMCISAKRFLTIEGTTNSNLATHLLTLKHKEKNRLINRLNRLFSPSRFKFK
jgi:hypothetical protein